MRHLLPSFGNDLHEIKNAVQSIDKNAQAYQRKEQPKPEVVAILHEPESVQTERHTTNRGTQRRDRIRLFVEWLTLFAVVFYGYMAVRQWREMIRANHASEQSARAATSAAATAKEVSDNATRSFHIGERPYVTIASVDFETPLESDKEIGVAVIVDNSGHSPALKVSYVTSAFMDGRRIGQPVAHEGATVIAFGHPAKKHFIMQFSSPDVAHMKASSDAFKLQGEIKYTDIFGEWHPTTWCSMYDGKQKVFKFCPYGNDVR